MKLDLTYLPAEDRMQLSVQSHTSWLMTRSLLLKLVTAWMDKIESIDLPNIGIPLGQRDIGHEHALSLEFDGPTKMHTRLLKADETILLEEITLSIDALGTKIVLHGQARESTINLTRKESHIFLEMLAQKIRQVAWLETVTWPEWLGTRNNAQS